MINISNHNSAKWSPEQLQAAGGTVINVPHPVINPEWSETELFDFVSGWIRDNLIPVLDLNPNDNQPKNPIAIHLMGETGFCGLVAAFCAKLHNMIIVHSTTIRETIELADGKKVSVFRFVQFRRTGSVETQLFELGKEI